MLHAAGKKLASIPIRWRLALVVLGLLVVLLSVLGEVILWTAERDLLTNEASALQSEARTAVIKMKGHPFLPGRSPGPLPGPLPPGFLVHASSLVDRLTSPDTHAAILSPQGKVIISGESLFLVPPSVILSPQEVQQALLVQSRQNNSYLLAQDSQRQRQIVIFVPLVNKGLTVAILQLSAPTAQIDHFIRNFSLILIISIVATLGIAAALMLPLIRAALHPLVVIERTSRRIAEGALSERLDVPATNDEIGRLARSFNRMVAQLEIALARQKQFVSDVSHELRTPLTALSGSLEMLLLGADRGDMETSRRLAKGMYAELKRMQRLVTDLLELTRIDEGKITLREDEVDVGAVLEKVYEQAQQLSLGQAIYRDVAAHLPVIRADADKLQQVLLNIVENALKFTPADGRVELIARSEGRAGVSIVVRDSGRGIPAEALPHIFDRFYRVDPARSRQLQRADGSGLGLAIARELIEAQGGRIMVESTPGVGTTFTLRFKAVTPQPSAALTRKR
jgi:two-component system OmpR family sensor kinase